MIPIQKTTQPTVAIDVNNIIELQGITSGKINTLGSCVGDIFCNNKFYKQTFHIVKNNLKLEHDGILGSDFLYKHQVKISFSNNMGEEEVNRVVELRELKMDLAVIKKLLGLSVQQNDEVTSNNYSEVELIKPIDLKVIDQFQCGNKSKLIPNKAEVIHESMISNQSINSNSNIFFRLFLGYVYVIIINIFSIFCLFNAIRPY